ncbi:ABC transporter ATP-binding protein [Streptomyces sp. WP-1]|uniref:ABC transporter ATP-binding protein n=1 Tax=Streptomyces sp. WP-1 TaxID=3041497 RepID=UPI0026485790|nr:ABC transporter ATP-binding protein [Streptomyces sp. WP-1]WKE68288.1 ABC transporter ATP-binding protein [Streptomyces sp. WP-1]
MTRATTPGTDPAGGGAVAPSPGAAVSVRALRRTFRTGGRRRGADTGERVALQGIDLDIAEGEVHGLLGPNGAGKTTLCKILSTVLLPSSGSVHVLGHDVAADPGAVRPLIGIVFGGERGLYDRLTARQNLVYWASLYGMSGRRLATRSAELLEQLGLGAHADDRVERFSRGMKQRLHLARGLVHDPQVVLLDEPTAGMDPVSAHGFRDLVTGLRAEGRTVLVTTHDMGEAEAICDRVTLINRGTVVASATPAELGAWVAESERVVARDVPPGVLARLTGLTDVEVVPADAQGLTVLRVGPGGDTSAVLQLLVGAGVRELSTSQPGLEEVYLRLIGRRGMEVSR